MGQIISDFADWVLSILINLWNALLQTFINLILTLKDMFYDLFIFILDSLFTALIAFVDFIFLACTSSTNNFNVSSYISGLGSEILNIIGLIGLGDAVQLIICGIGIRLLLQLIPFTRLGS